MPAIGALTLEIRVEHARSLKDKRQVVRALKDRLRGKFNVAVAEIEGQETWQRSVLAVVTVSADARHAATVLESAESEAAALLGAMLVGTSIEWI